MDLQDLIKNNKGLIGWKLERKLNELVIENYHFRNLSKENRKLILDLIKKYKTHIIRGEGISSIALREENYHLYQNRIKLGLTELDLKDIKMILEMFKK